LEAAGSKENSLKSRRRGTKRVVEVKTWNFRGLIAFHVANPRRYNGKMLRTEFECLCKRLDLEAGMTQSR
jgi:hypothetical protein